MARWVLPPSLSSMAPKREMSPSRTARSGIWPDANHLLSRYEAQTATSRSSVRAELAFAKRFSRE